MAELTTPHLAFPLRLNSGRLAANEEGSLPEVRDSIRVLLRTPLGARPLAPQVGVPDPTFTTTGTQPELLTAALTHPETGDPRATVQIHATPVTATGRQNVTVRVGLADQPAAGDTAIGDTSP